MVAKDNTVHFPVNVKFISADLKDVTSMMDGYVDVLIGVEPVARFEAHEEKDAGKSLKWNDEANLFVRADMLDMLAQNPNLSLVFCFRSQDPSGDTYIGETTVLLLEVISRITLAAYNRVEHIVTYPVVSRSAKRIGTVKVSFKVDDLVGTPPPEEVAQAAVCLLYEIMPREGARDPSDDNKYQAGYLFDDMVAGLPEEAAREPHPHLSDHYATHSAVRGARSSFTEKTKNIARDAVNEILDKLDAKVTPKFFKNKLEPVNARPVYAEYARPAYAEYARPQHHYSGHTQAASAYAPPHQQHSWHMPDAPPQPQPGWHMPYAPPQPQPGWYMPYAPPQPQPYMPYAPPQPQPGWHMPYAPPQPQPYMPYAPPQPQPYMPAAYAVRAPPQENNNLGGMLGKVVQWLTFAKLSGDVAGMSADFDGMGADE